MDKPEEGGPTALPGREQPTSHHELALLGALWRLVGLKEVITDNQ